MKHLIFVACALSLISTAAHAQSGTQPPPVDEYELPAETYPANFTQRPITLPAMTIKADLAFGVLHLPDPLDNTLVMNLGGAFGITDDFEVGISGDRQGLTNALGAGLVPLYLSPDFDFGDIYLYGRYRFLSSESFQMGVELGFNIPTATDFGLIVAVPFRARLGDIFSIDGGLEVFTVFADDTEVGIRATVQPRIAPVDFLYFGLDLGFVAGFTDPNVIIVPLGFEAGYVIDLDTVKIDAYLNFSFPSLHYSADFGDPIGRDGDAVTDIWQLTIGARAFIGLGG